MKKAILIFAITLFAHLAVRAQQMETVSGTTLDNKQVTIPVDVKGKYTLICFAAGTKSQKDLESWLDPVYQRYIAKTGIMDDAFDVNVFFIPLLKGANKSFEGTLKRKFADNTPLDLKSHVLFSDTPAEPLMASLQMSNPDIPYILLLNKEGSIIYRTNGAYTEEKFDAIDDLIE